MSLPETVSPNDRTLTRLERALYCDDVDRNLDHDPDRPDAWSANLLSETGRHSACFRPVRTSDVTRRLDEIQDELKSQDTWTARKSPTTMATTGPTTMATTGPTTMATMDPRVPLKGVDRP